MTPFDPVALLTILLAFYQPASSAHFAQCYRERPSYFCGGTIFGTHGDKLRLPDGVAWDFIFDVDGPNARYQAILAPPDDGGTGPDPFFPLEPGPLRPIDYGVFPPPTPRDEFGPLVADAIARLGASDARLGDNEDQIAGRTSPWPLRDAFDRTVGPAERALSDELGALDASVPEDVLDLTGHHVDAVDANDREYDDPPPDPIDPDPGDADDIILPPPPPPDEG